ncbi:MAG: diadenylate cyclase [Candidatus Brocadiia bacterium]
MNKVTEKILGFSRDLARDAGAAAILVYADVFSEEEALRHFVEASGDCEILLASRRAAGEQPETGATVVPVPEVKLTRVGQLKVAILLALSRGCLEYGDSVVCLTGIAGTGVLDTVMFMELGEEFEMFASAGTSRISGRVEPHVLEQIMDMAITLGNEGREGKPVGTCFVVGDTEGVLQHSRPMILNPFRGYSEEERNLMDPEVQETVKEFSTIDGAFLIRQDGVVEAAGLHLETAAEDVEVPRGLGARHQSAAAVTALTDAVAVTVSESSGNVTVFRDGKVVMEIEKPRPIGKPTALRREFFGQEEAGIDFESGATAD